MKKTTLIKAFLNGACVYYSLLSLGLILFYLIGGAGQSSTRLFQFLFFFPCGLALSGARMLRRSSVLSAWSRQILHFLIFMLAFLLFLWLPSGQHASTFTLTLFSLLALGYWLVYLIVHFTVKRFRGFREE